MNNIFGTAGATAASGVTGMMIAGMNNMFASRMAADDRKENYEYNEKAANNADARTRALYHDFYSPEALMRQYKEAGLSPSMMFGGTPGQGGTSGAQGAGPNGPRTTYTPVSMLEAAQAASLFADANLKEEQANELKGENAFGKAEITKIYADAAAAAAEKGLKEVETELTATENALKSIEVAVASDTYNDQVDKVHAEAVTANENATKAMYEANKAGVDWKLAQETFNAQKTKIEQEAYAAVQQVLALKTQNKYLDDQLRHSIAKIIAEVSNIEWRQDFDLACKRADALFKQMEIVLQHMHINLEAEGIDVEKWKTKIHTATEIFSSMVKGGFLFGGLTGRK